MFNKGPFGTLTSADLWGSLRLLQVLKHGSQLQKETEMDNIDFFKSCKMRCFQ